MSGGRKVTTFPRIFVHVLCRFNSIVFAIQPVFRRILEFPWYRQREPSTPAVTVTTPTAQAANAYGCVSMTTRLDPSGSSEAETAARNVIPPGSAALAQAHPLTNPPAMRKQPGAGVDPVTVHPLTRSDVCPRWMFGNTIRHIYLILPRSWSCT